MITCHKPFKLMMARAWRLAIRLEGDGAALAKLAATKRSPRKRFIVLCSQCELAAGFPLVRSFAGEASNRRPQFPVPYSMYVCGCQTACQWRRARVISARKRAAARPEFARAGRADGTRRGIHHAKTRGPD